MRNSLRTPSVTAPHQPLLVTNQHVQAEALEGDDADAARCSALSCARIACLPTGTPLATLEEARQLTHLGLTMLLAQRVEESGAPDLSAAASAARTHLERARHLAIESGDAAQAARSAAALGAALEALGEHAAALATLEEVRRSSSRGGRGGRGGRVAGVVG